MKAPLASPPTKGAVLTLTIISVVLAAVGQLLLKVGVDLLPHRLILVPASLGVLFHPVILLGFAFYVLSALIWLKVLSWAELSMVYPFLALSYVIVVLSSWLFLRESLGPLKLLGIALIIAGILVLSRGDLRGRPKRPNE